MNSLETLTQKVLARYPIILVNSTEEARVEREIAGAIPALAESFGQAMAVFVWTATDGFRPLAVNGQMVGVADLPQKPDTKMAVEFLYSMGCVRDWPKVTGARDSAGKVTLNMTPTIFLFEDAWGYVASPNDGKIADMRRLRAIRDLKRALPLSSNTIIFLQPQANLPGELEKDVTVIDWELPDSTGMESLVDNMIETSGVEVSINGSRPDLIRALRGLTEDDATNILSLAIATQGKVDAGSIQFVIEEKRQAINKARSYGLEYIMGDPAIAGLYAMREAMRVDMMRFTDEARTFGVLHKPSAFIVGVQGTGKSQVIKTLGEGKTVILRFDPNAAEGRYVGDTEANTRGALRTAEAIAPCIFHVDEGGKSFARGGDMDTSGGAKLGQLATLLTWMQECQKPVFVTMTSNEGNIDPALLRRFNSVWFVDVPTHAARIDILACHLAKRGGRTPQDYDLNRIADKTNGYTGAELEKMVEAAILKCFVDGKRELRDADLLDEIGKVVPIIVANARQVESMRAWAKSNNVRDAETGLPYGQEAAPATPTYAYRQVKVKTTRKAIK